MSQTISDKVRWTTADLELLPDNGDRYELIDGELFVTRAPHWGHQQTCGRFFSVLDTWSMSAGLGRAAINPGLIFTEADNVIPDVVWASNERLALLLDEAGHLTGAPELVVEVLSAGTDNERRDRDLKLRLYSVRGVQEYWIANWRLQQIEVYRREQASLRLVATLLRNDQLTSPLLPGFSCSVAQVFA
ncbi:MAG: Uma2 family endonuclease [Microcoleus sp. PH2017_40_RAT_O_B]|uniref:Uma2 family endonuclease n=1 Tax=unclassified Microcoleus TaxID=2642155 RepID=UPI001DDB00B0|nr:MULTISPECIES: Uma2 family endonuclease [unclassified Microcoleus]MCC3572083.1 Uma2 family endonuclease [Microcoleus sp. PH2017_34_RAT_O_A]MCC3610106.1 Uma2 family endonuclease [Microcoleus sp. PH2017_40_RAT_O_B]